MSTESPPAAPQEKPLVQKLLNPVPSDARVYADYIVDVVLAVCVTAAFWFDKIDQATWQSVMGILASGRIALRFLSRSKDGSSVRPPDSGAAVALLLGLASLFVTHKRT